MQFSSALLESAVNEFARLPGIGKKTALRLVLHLLKQETAEVQHFGEVIARMRAEIRFCQRCYNVADGPVCSICANRMRKQETICVVETIRDVIAIESTQQYNGVYHVLGGVISPLDGVGPDQLHIETLVNRIATEHTEELIFALNPTIQGDTTIYYIQKRINAVAANASVDAGSSTISGNAGTSTISTNGDASRPPIKITTIARGIAFGGELEYADEMTLARSLQNRLPVDRYVSN